jgi:hypothetical protein
MPHLIDIKRLAKILLPEIKAENELTKGMAVVESKKSL